MAMDPIDAAFVSEAFEGLDNGGEILNMRDGHSEFWGAEELAKRLESTDHVVEWIFNNTKMQQTEGAEHPSLIKNGGMSDGWDDGYLVTKLGNVNGLVVGQKVAGCHVKFGLTTSIQDTQKFENGFYCGIYPEKKVTRGVKGRETTCAKYEMYENFTVRVQRGSATLTRNDEENPFDVIGHCEEEGTSMHALIHIKERDAMGVLDRLYAVALVKSIDCNGNYFTDAGIERLAPALEVDWTKIVHLDAGLNRIRCKGAMRLAEVLEKSCCKISTMVLSHNEIGDEGVSRLAEAISKKGSTLTKLWLTGNQIADEGAMKVAEALESEHSKLTLIELAWNKIEDEGAQRVIQAISKPECKIEEFALDHNKYVDKKTKKMLTAIMAKVPRLVDMT